MAKYISRKKLYIGIAGAVVLIAAAVIIVRIRLQAATLKTVVTNQATLTYQANGTTVNRTSNSVGVTIETVIPTPTPTPGGTTGQILTAADGSRITTQRFKLSAQTSEKTVVTLVFDYFSKDKPLPSADSTITTSRRLQLTSRDRLTHTIDQNGNANQYIVGYFEVKKDGKIAEKSDYYYLDTPIGSTFAPLP